MPEDFILCGAGAAELIYAYCDALRPKKAMELAPTFLEYSAAASHFGAEMVRVPLQAPEFLPDSKIFRQAARGSAGRALSVHAE